MPLGKFKVLVTGANGQLGKEIQRQLGKKFNLILTDTDNMDITDKQQVDRVIKREKPDCIIHAAAYTQVDAAEENRKLCRKINALGTKNIAEAASKIGAILIYISTDYIFDGKKNRPYTERDEPHPLSVYGRTKLKGENYTKALCKKYYIIRTAWVFGEGKNFVETMLTLAKKMQSINVVNDQIGSPTCTKDLVMVIGKIIESKIAYGIYNFSGLNPCSWYDFAKEIFSQTGTSVLLKPILSTGYPQKAKRPAYSYLDKYKIQKALGISIRTWKEMLEDYLSNN